MSYNNKQYQQQQQQFKQQQSTNSYAQAFNNLSNTTKELTIKPAPLIIKKVDFKYKNISNREAVLKEARINPRDIDNCIYTQAGNILI